VGCGCPLPLLNLDLDLNLDFKSIDLKCHDSKSIDFKISCLDPYKGGFEI
jgi:hypothetical protein